MNIYVNTALNFEEQFSLDVVVTVLKTVEFGKIVGLKSHACALRRQNPVATKKER